MSDCSLRIVTVLSGLLLACGGDAETKEKHDAGSAALDGSSEDAAQRDASPEGDSGARPPLTNDQTCKNGKQDKGETDVDCGGRCARCKARSLCEEDTDCRDGMYCIGGRRGLPARCRLPVPDCYPNPCKEDEYCDRFGVFATPQGERLSEVLVCFEVPGEGGTCSNLYKVGSDAPVCAGGLRCDVDRCVEGTLARDAPCEVGNNLCVSGLVCARSGSSDTGGLCTPPRALHERCNVSRECAKGLWCDAAVCKPQSKPGAKCSDTGLDEECEVGLTCVFEVCERTTDIPPGLR